MKLLSRIFALLFFTVCAAVFSNCSSDPVANGTGSNAGETELAGVITVTNSSGHPLARAAARVWVLHKDTIQLAFEDTLNESGTLEFKSTIRAEDKSSIQLIETHSGDSLSVMRWVDLGKKPSQTLAAVASASLKGTITHNGEAVKGATIRILDKSTETDASGNFTFEGLPSGVHYAFVEGNFGKFSYQMETDLEEYATTNNIDIAESVFTVVEDFENWKSRQTLLGKSFGQGWWFICTDSLQGGGSHVQDGISSPNILVTGDSAKDGSSLHLIFDLDEETPGHYGVAGFTIGDDFDEDEMFSFYDLRSAIAISFDAKGSGELFLQITKRSDEGKREYHKTWPVTLTDEWQHFTFTAEDFDTELAAVNSLNFMVESDAEIYLDNVRFDGISPSMWPSLGMRF